MTGGATNGSDATSDDDHGPPLVIALGASAGGVPVLQAIVAGLPRDLPAAVLVVLHVPADGASVLAGILERAGNLPAVAPERPEALESGRLYVARPGRHLMVERGYVRPTLGPTENGHRPAVDATFRSLATAYGPRSMGVVLTGNRDDGTAGLQRIKASGGYTMVQDPDECRFPGMPRNALALVDVDAVLRSHEIAARIVERAGTGPGGSMSDQIDSTLGDATRFTCPDCGGVMRERLDGRVEQLACTVGHAYSPESFDAEHARTVEYALWHAARVLDDRAALMRDMAKRAERTGRSRSVGHYLERADEAVRHAEALRTMVERAEVTLPPQPQEIA